MFERVLLVKYVSAKNCFVHLSSKHSKLSTGACFKIVHNDNQTAYFSADIVNNLVDIDSIGINSVVAKSLGINENDLVNASELEQLPVVKSISVQPYNNNDYEVLELLAEHVQSNLLDQVRVVNTGQNLVMWIGSSISVQVFVESVTPVTVGVLDFLTEVIIKPPSVDQNLLRKNLGQITEAESEFMNCFLSFLNANVPNIDCLEGIKDTSINLELCYRLYLLSELPEVDKAKLPQPFKVFVSREGQYSHLLKDSHQHLFFTISLLGFENSKELSVQLCFLSDFSDNTFRNNLSNNIYVDKSLLNYFNCLPGKRVILKSITNPTKLTQIELHHGESKESKEVLEKFKLYLSENNAASKILNANFPIKIDENLYVSVKFPSKPLANYCVLDEGTIRDCSFSFCLEQITPLHDITSKETVQEFCQDLVCVDSVINDVLATLWKNGYFQSENIIITGKTGMGKSSVLKYIIKILEKYPYFVHTEVVHCKTIKGKTVESLHKIFIDLFAELVLTQPSLLVLDDLNVLCESSDGEETPNTVYFNRVSEMVYNVLSAYNKENEIAIIASVNSLSTLNKIVYRSRGNHLFKNVFAIEDLTKCDRDVLLRYFFNNQPTKELDYNDLAMKTDGFVIQDIKDFYDKAYFEAYKNASLIDCLENMVIEQDHCDQALQKTCSLSLQNVNFHTAGHKSFKDIGGLHDVKKTLIESFLWPVKYSNIYSKAPLRLQSGLLLYGAPGTGKTLLAGAAAKQCNLRLILVKGPELLSKYIGASEQAVRDVFEKAQRAKPCILFFDEFESLAPRRGHDNTGVTDRVVNQLLTQLDGVESLTGVCVLASTSRPDLLDPALLRPGRLDKQVLCPIPGKSDRHEVLEVLSRNLELEDDVDLGEIADKTEGFTGADLKSLLYTTQMSTLKMTGEDECLTKLKVTQKDITNALLKTRPSLTRSENEKYQRIYKKFQGGTASDFFAGSKVTLA